MSNKLKVLGLPVLVEENPAKSIPYEQPHILDHTPVCKDYKELLLELNKGE